MCPSGNRYWRVFRGRAVKSPEARAYIARVMRLYRTTPLAGRVAVRLDLYLCRGDIDNRAKVALDALKGIAFVDDRQVRSLQVEGYEANSKTERIVVLVTQHQPVPSIETNVGLVRSGHWVASVSMAEALRITPNVRKAP